MLLESERLIQRRIGKEDADKLFDYRSDRVTNMYQGFIPTSLEQVERFLEGSATEINIPESRYQVGVYTKLSKKLIGDISLHFTGRENRQVEIGVTLKKDYQSNGYASEALKVLLDYLFNELDKHRVYGYIDPENVASMALMKKLGFVKEAHFRQSYLLNGEWRDDTLYALLKSDWMK